MPAASDPAGPTPGSTPGVPALPLRFRPLGVRVASVGFGVLLTVTIVAVWLTMPARAREDFTWLQRATVLVMCAAVFAIAHAISRCRVDADQRGVTVVNGYRTHRLDWGQLVAVTLRPGNPWAVLDLSDGTTRSVMGIQGSDGLRARRQTRQLRALIEARAGDEPPRPPREPEDGDPGDS